MLIDIALPHVVHVPWPKITRDGTDDWVSSMELVEEWLCDCVGPHSEEWAWSIDHQHWCSVCFARESYITLFMLRFGATC